MLTVFNRKELVSVFDLEKLPKIREVLEAASIEYTVKTVSRVSPSPAADGHRGTMGTTGENLNQNMEYTVYVAKQDYDEALALLKRVGAPLG